MEIEKKFLVKNLPNNLESFKKTEISQGYISDINPTIRIRKFDNQHILTIKSVENIAKDKQHLINEEIEFNISKEKFYKLSTKVDNNFIEKTRYFVEITDNIAELDIYHNALSPLITVEVEFQSEAQALEFNPPAWFGEEVTDDIRYKNFYLSKNGIPDSCKIRQ